MPLKEGDWVRTSSAGKDYRVKWIGDRMVVLETDDRTSQFLTTIESVRPLFASQSRTTKRLPAEERKIDGPKCLTSDHRDSFSTG
jgi:hypothetical protein